MKPDAYIVSGSQWASKTNAAVPFGYGVTQQQVDEAFNRMKQRPGFAQVSAVKEGRFYGIYHNFYNHPYNIVGLEYLAKFIYPAQFPDLDPPRPSEILSRFTEVPEGRAFGRAGAGEITATARRSPVLSSGGRRIGGDNLQYAVDDELHAHAHQQEAHQARDRLDAAFPHQAHDGAGTEQAAPQDHRDRQKDGDRCHGQHPVQNPACSL